MRILFVGAGATGGYFGGLLAAAGKDVTFLVRPARAEALAARGLRIITPDGTTTTHPTLITADKLDAPYDLIILAVKAYALNQAMTDLAPAVGPATVIVPLLNGMRHLDLLVSRFGPEHVYGGVCMIAATITADGDIQRMTGLHRLGYGPLTESESVLASGSEGASVSVDAVQRAPDAVADALSRSGLDGGRSAAVADALSGAGFDSAPSGDIVQDMWEKWVFLATLGAATTLMRGPVSDILAAPGGPAFARALTDEAIAIAAAAGHAPSPGAVEFLRAGISTPGVPTTSSMYRDLTAGLPIEADEIIGDLVAHATKHNVPAPLFSAAYTNLAIYSANRPT